MALCFFDGTPQPPPDGVRRKRKKSSSNSETSVVMLSEREQRQAVALEAFAEAAHILATELDDMNVRVSLLQVDAFDPYTVDVAAMFDAIETELPVIKLMQLGSAAVSKFDRSASRQNKWVDYEGPLDDGAVMAELIADAAENPALAMRGRLVA